MAMESPLATIPLHEFRKDVSMTLEAVSRRGFVVLIEPDDGVRHSLDTLLRGHGWAVNASAEAAQLESILERERVTAVVCESEIPGRNSSEVLQVCRDYEVPVIFMGHDFSLQGALDIVRGGASDFLEKPFPQARLLNLLNSLPKTNTQTNDNTNAKTNGVN